VEEKAKVEAIADARHQAETLAVAEGAKVDKMIAISTAPMPVNFFPALNLLAGPAAQGEISIIQQVVVEYGLVGGN
jgi:uncharacterized protein YggE